ncbi:MAG: alanine racemase [Thermoleophilaceae bacterium]
MTEVERAVARIATGAIEGNVRHLRSLLDEGTQLCAVVKADGYGHGHAAAARAALGGGADWLAVATAHEAQLLREAGLGDARVLVMGALTRSDLEIALAARADVVAWTRELVDAIGRAGVGGARAHVKLDSGMGRLGTKDPAEARELCDLVAATDGLELAGLMTHFATADERGDDHFPHQLGRFEELARDLRAQHPGVTVHAANSAATYRDKRSHFDLVRCGVAIYGLDPFGEDPAERGLAPALELESYVASVKPFEPGDSAGYGRTWKASKPTWVGVLPIGYGDGWRRGLSNNCDVLVKGRRCPLVGTVSMDNVTVDLGPDTEVRPGERAVLIGEQDGERILCEEVATRLNTINYEVTCGLTARVRREHR